MWRRGKRGMRKEGPYIKTDTLYCHSTLQGLLKVRRPKSEESHCL